VKIESLKLEHFRNIAHADLTFCDGVNVLFGNNAQGKTNLAESIALFSQGRSFRNAKEKEMIAFDCDMAKMALTFQDKERTHHLEYNFTEKKRFCKKNNAILTKISELVGCLQTVVFAPAHLSIVSGEPQMRRNFLDVALLPFSPSHIEDLRRYKQVLAQRNAYLKQKEELFTKDDALMASLKEQLCEIGVRIAQRRVAYLNKLQVYAASILSELSLGKEVLELQYIGATTKEEYLQNAQRLFLAEQYRKTSLFGAHRDDFTVLLNRRDAKDFASQGQQRSVALALKLAEGELLYQKEKEYPVFLLDDIFSELDTKRKHYVMQGLQNRQVILTTCDESVKNMWENACVYRVENGVFTREA
jgi:DNA replication and repair protein RecF